MLKIKYRKQPGAMIFADDRNFYEVLDSLRDELVLINFLHDGKDFEKQLNLLLKTQQEYRYAFNVIIVSKAVSENISRDFNVIGTPTIVVVQNGRQIDRFLGSMEAGELEEILQKAMAAIELTK